MEDYVVVIGSAGMDVKGQPLQMLQMGTPNLGNVRTTVGGVARNIAENLARLEVPTVLLTAVGEDLTGQQVIQSCEDAGIDCQYAQQVPDGRTGTYMALMKPDGQLDVAISDFEIISTIDSDYILDHRSLIRSADLVVIDATLTEDTLDTVFDLADQHNIRVAADPTTPSLAGRLCQYISQLYMVVPNASEIESLCNLLSPEGDRDKAIQTARELVAMGTEIAVVTMGEDGLAYADGSGQGYLRAIKTEVVDSTGAGDAFTSAAIFGLLNEVPVDEAMRLGITAASLNIGSDYTVLPSISQELLYDNLMA